VTALSPDLVLVRRLVSWRALAVLLAVGAFFYSWWIMGPPVTRLGQMIWVLVVILVANVGRGVKVHRILLDWLPLFAVLWLYDYTRGWATMLGIPTHYTWTIDTDKLLFHGVVPTAWLQAHFYNPSVVHWYDEAAGLVYLSHFIATFALGTALYIVSRRRWARFMRRFLVLAIAGLATYVLYPAAPPWLADYQGYITGVRPITGHGMAALHMAPTEHWLRVGSAHANYVAAVPSLHAGFSMLIALFLIFERRPVWPRLWLFAYPVAMGLALVYCGEHYVTDVLLGWLYAVATMLAVGAWERWRERRRIVRLERDMGLSDTARPPGGIDQRQTAGTVALAD